MSVQLSETVDVPAAAPDTSLTGEERKISSSSSEQVKEKKPLLQSFMLTMFIACITKKGDGGGSCRQVYRHFK
jgi:hypothetical protein